MDPENPTFPTPPPQPVIAPISAPIPKKKSFILILHLVLIVVIALVVGYLFLQVQSLTKQLAQSQVQVQPTPLPNETPSPTTDPTANWKTYSNTKYSYSLKYPQNLVLESQGPDGPVTSDGLPTTDATLIILSDPTQTNFPDREILSIDYRELLTAQPNWNSTVVKLGDTQATKLTSSNPEVKFDIYQVSFKNGGLEITANKTQPAILIDQILSTFKFTD